MLYRKAKGYASCGYINIYHLNECKHKHCSQQVGREEGAGAHATLSYKASLVGDFPGAYALAFKFQVEEEEEPFFDEEVDDPPEGFVAIKLSKRTKINIRAK